MVNSRMVYSCFHHITFLTLWMSSFPESRSKCTAQAWSHPPSLVQRSQHQCHPREAQRSACRADSQEWNWSSHKLQEIKGIIADILWSKIFQYMLGNCWLIFILHCKPCVPGIHMVSACQRQNSWRSSRLIPSKSLQPWSELPCDLLGNIRCRNIIPLSISDICMSTFNHVHPRLINPGCFIVGVPWKYQIMTIWG